MPQNIAIHCGEGKDAYQVNITVKDLATFHAAESRPGIAGKEGEELVAALVAARIILALDRSKNGKFNDGPKGEPAIQVFNDKGILVRQGRGQNGILTDGANGGAGDLEFYDDGAPATITHYKDGIINGGANGEPPVRALDEQGRLIFLALGANGVDTVLEFNSSGQLTSAGITKEDGIVELSEKEIADYAKLHKKEIAGYVAAYSIPKPVICAIWPKEQKKKSNPPPRPR